MPVAIVEKAARFGMADGWRRKGRGRAMLGSSLINTAAGLLSLAAGLGSSIVVARLLGVEGAGTVAYALWIMTVATLVSDLGIPQALLRFPAKGEGDKAGVARALARRFALATGLAAAAILALAAWSRLAANAADAWVWAATAGLFLAYAWSTLALGAGQGLSRFRETSLATAAGCLIQPFAVALGAVLVGPAGAIAGHMLRHLPLALTLRRYVPSGGPKPVPPSVDAYARNTWLSGGLAALLGSRVELAIIGFWFGVAEVGQYATGATMAGMVVQLSFSLAAVLVPLFAAHHDRGDAEALARSYRRSLLGLSLLLAPICFGGAAVAPVLVPALFGADFAPAGDLAMVLVAFAFAQALTTVPYRMMLAQERSRAVLHLSIWEGVGCIALTMAVVPFWGAAGAAWAKGLTAAASALFCLGYCRICLNVPFQPSPLLKTLLAAALCAAAAAAVVAWRPGLGGLAAAIAAGAAVYAVMLRLLSAVPPDERRMIAGWAQARLPAVAAKGISLVLGPAKP